jgi:hypothetical protein
MVLEGMDVITGQLSELLERINQPDQERVTIQQPPPSGNPITINANGAVGGITINIDSAGAVVTSNTPKKAKRLISTASPSSPPKSDLQSFWDGIFGLGGSVIESISDNVGVLALGAIGVNQADNYSHYEDNTGRAEYYDLSTTTDNSIMAEGSAE